MQCAHHLCSCTVTDDHTHCSSVCSTETAGEYCPCGHEDCTGGPKIMREIDADVFDPHTVAESVTSPGSTIDRPE